MKKTLASTLLGLALSGAGCAHAPEARLTGPTVEVALDDGRPQEKPLTPNRSFEVLMRFDPRLPSYRLRQMRIMIAQAGGFSFNVYTNGPGDAPGDTLKAIEREYSPSLASTGQDGKWVIESLTDVPPQKGPVWIGISTRGTGDARLWASSNDSGEVFSRDADPTTPLSANRLRRTPMVRLELLPGE